MTRAALAIIAVFASIFATAETNRTATENWTRNRINEATNGLATAEDVESKADKATTLEGYGITNAATKTEFDVHVAGITNPHKVTAEQVGAYTKKETNQEISNAISLIQFPVPYVPTKVGELENDAGYVTASVTNGLASSASVDAKVTNAVVKDAENVVTGSFSIKRKFNEYEQSLSFEKNDPNGPSIVLNRLYSTAQDSFFSGAIALIPSSGEKTSLLSRIKEYSGASWDARQEVESIVSSAMLPTNPTFSNAVLAVGLNIDTNSVAVLNEIASTFGGFPVEGTATTVGGLLAALAAAVAWLRKKKIDKLTVTGMSKEVTADGGVAKLDDFFTESNSLLIGTIKANAWGDDEKMRAVFITFARMDDFTTVSDESDSFDIAITKLSQLLGEDVAA